MVEPVSPGLGDGLVHVGGKRLPGDLDQRRERRGIVDRQLCEHLAVYLDAGDLQPLDEPVVGDALGTGSGVDPLDPEPAERALAVLAVPVGIGHGVELLLLGLAVQPGALAAVTARALQDHPALLVGIDRPLYACHLFDSLASDRVTCPAASSCSWRRRATASRNSPGGGSSCSACAQGNGHGWRGGA